MSTLNGEARASLDTFRGQTQIVLFWRSDCTRCLVELGHVRALEDAAGEAALITVALESRQTAQPKAQALNLDPARSFVVTEDAAAALAKVSLGGQRIPFAMAITPRGEVCARHTGMIGAARIREWVKTCST